MKRIIIITGTRKGIGYYLATAYLRQGDEVYGCSRRSCDIVHDNYHHACLDVANEEGIYIRYTDVSMYLSIMPGSLL